MIKFEDMSKLEIDEYGTKRYYNSKGQLHRKNNPAIIYQAGSIFWYINDKCHRIDGPSCVYVIGDKFWFLEGNCIRKFEYD